MHAFVDSSPSLYEALASGGEFVGFGLLFMVILLWFWAQRRSTAKLTQLTTQLAKQRQEHQDTEATLRQTQQSYQAIIEGAREGIVVAQEGKIVYSNPSFLEIVGRTWEEMENTSIDTYLHKKDKTRALDNHRKRIAGEALEQRYPIRFITREKEVIWVEISGTRVVWCAKPATLNFIVDITEQVKKEEFMQHIAQYDQLTGLPNRWLLDDRLDAVLRTSKRTGDSFGLIFMELDQFKLINDTFGYEIGDALLVAIAKRIKALLRESDTVARVGGDEYAVLLPLAAHPEDVTLVVEKIHETLRQPFELLGHTLLVSCCAGVAFYPLNGTTRMELYRYADHAMYAQKYGHVSS